ncbi:hypothetical protein TrRE_jg12179, partial [Triparma retinervis]
MPKVIGKARTVVSTPTLKIDELCGNATTSCDTISIASVSASAGASEPWLTLLYDEWMCVTKGSMELLTDGPEGGVVVAAGETVFIGKGERFKPTFPTDCEYIPVCLPAFTPDRCIREDAETSEGAAIAANLAELHSKPPPLPKPEVLYHMCQRSAWE